MSNNPVITRENGHKILTGDFLVVTLADFFDNCARHPDEQFIDDHHVGQVNVSGIFEHRHIRIV